MVLPAGTSAEEAFAKAIVSDAEKLAAAATYWKGAFSALGETALQGTAFSSEAMAFAQALPDVPLSDAFPEFKKLNKAETGLRKKAGALMSLAEIINSKEIKASPADCLAYLGQQEGTASVEGVDRKKLIDAFHLVREVYDLIRRYNICRENSIATGLALSELLALYSQEGALGICPPQSSWNHAPLIHTTPNGRAASAMNLWDVANGPNQGTTTRDAFIVAHTFNAGITPSRSNSASLSFGIALRHIFLIGGLDTLVIPRLSQTDDLLAFYQKIRQASSGGFADIEALITNIWAQLERKPGTSGSIHARQSVGTSQQSAFEGVVIGQMMLQIESAVSADQLPDAQRIAAGARKGFEELMAAHSIRFEQNRLVFLAPGDSFEDARVCLKLQAQWFRTRRRVDTLLALRDRFTSIGEGELHPFLAYIRFNIGEFGFMRMLCRFLTKLLQLKKPNKFDLHPDFEAELAKLSWSATEHSAAEARYQTVRDNAKIEASPGWRHLGWLDRLEASGFPMPGAPAPERAILKMAEVARKTVAIYTDKGLFGLLERFLLLHSIELSGRTLNVVGMKRDPDTPETVTSTVVLVNAFNFELVRRSYETAIVAAGLNDRPVGP